MEQVRVGFVGAGMMSQTTHIPCFQQAQGAQVTAVASSRPALLAHVADRFAIRKRYAGHRDLAQDPDIDLAAVIVPPEVNVDICIDLVEAGKHVFCEKPVSLSAEDARRMADAASASNRLLMVGFMKRFDSGVLAAKGVVNDWRASGEMGKPLLARAHSFIGGDWTANVEALMPVIKTDEAMSDKPLTDLPEWVPEKYAGPWGPYYFLNHVHSHDMDLLNYFLGPQFEVLNADWRHDAKIVTLDFEGVPAIIEVGKCSQNNRWDEELTVYFEGGSVCVKLPPPMLINVPARVEVYHMGARQQVCDLHAPYGWSFLNQAQNAVDAVAEKAGPICTIQDGIAQVSMTEGIFRALA